MKLATTLAIQAHTDQMYRPGDYGYPLVNEPERKKTVAVDFDGVLNRSTGPYARGHFGKWNSEGLKMLKQLQKEGFEVVIFTARRETDLVATQLAKQGFPHMFVTNHKPPAICYIDDHAMHFKDDAKAKDIMKKVRLAAR